MMDLSSVTFFSDGQSLPPGMHTMMAVSPRFFSTTGLRVLRGSVFPLAGRAAHSVVVNATMAKIIWPSGDAVGHCIYFGARRAPCYRVIGVVEDSHQDRVVENPQPQYFLPLSDLPDSAKIFTGNWIVARADPAQRIATERALSSLLRDEFPDATPRFTLLSDFLEPQFRPWHLGATLFTAFGVLALIVAVVGMYSTVSYDVNQRTHEFGVRAALGARVGDVIALVIAGGLRTVVIGVALGLLLALAAGRLIASSLYDVRPDDPLAFAIVALVLVSAGALAALSPAWRASSVDPVTALRSE